MESVAVHPNQGLQQFFASSIRKMAYILAYWVDQTDPSRLDWVPGEPGVSKARTILDQMSELVNVNRIRAATLCGEAEDTVQPITLTNAQEVREALISSTDEVANLILAMSPDKLDETVDSFLGPMPLKDLLEIFLIWNMSYHGGVINAYQLMYGDEKFHIPPM